MEESVSRCAGYSRRARQDCVQSRRTGRQRLDDGSSTRSLGSYPGAGLDTTSSDLAKWDAALYTEKLVKGSTLERIWTRTPTIAERPPIRGWVELTWNSSRRGEPGDAVSVPGRRRQGTVERVRHRRLHDLGRTDPHADLHPDHRGIGRAVGTHVVPPFFTRQAILVSGCAA